jgi:hypothetical protein
MMKDVHELQDQMDHLRDAIEDAQQVARHLAQEQLIDREAVPADTRLKDWDRYRDF